MGKVRQYSGLFSFGALAVIAVALVIFGQREVKESSSTEKSTETAIVLKIDSGLPPKISSIITSAVKDLGWKMSDSDDNADVSITYDLGTNRGGCETGAAFYQIMVLTAPYSELLQPKQNIISDISESVDLMEGTIAVASYELDERTTEGVSLGLLQELSPDRFVLEVESFNPVKKNTWKNPTYQLISQVCIRSKSEHAQILFEKITRDTQLEDAGYLTELPTPDDFTTVIKTGTSVTGGPGWELCERTRGFGYPIAEISSELQAADISIISNETSFVEGCSQEAGTTAFCGKPSYLQNILDLGVDIISLTGNHMCDYGKAAFESMLDIYDTNDLLYFGGGQSKLEAWEPLFYETPAGTIAFIGYNKMGPEGVLAGENTAGSAYYDPELLKGAIELSQSQADAIWIDTHLWPEYGTTPSSEQIELTQEAIDFGADIVTGVSSHEIQGMTFYQDKAIFYGLGNFLFDQMWSDETRLGMALEVTIYDGNIVQIIPLPTRMYDYCQPRFLTGDDKQEILGYFLSISDLEN